MKREFLAHDIQFNEGRKFTVHLLKTLYGLKQSAKQFYLFLTKLLFEFDFTPIIVNQSVFYNNNTKIIIAIHIDDLLIFNNSLNKINELKLKINKKIEINDLSDAKKKLT